MPMRRTAEVSQGRGVGQHTTLPSFTLPTADGRGVRRWEYYARSALLVFVLHSPTCAPCRALVRTIAVHATAWEEAEAQPLVVFQTTPAALAEVAAALPAAAGRPPVLLADADGVLRQQLVGADPGVVALVTDRFGCVHHRARAADADGLDLADLVAWMAFVALQCAE